MNINPSELLRKLADLIDSASDPAGTGMELSNPPAVLSPVATNNLAGSDTAMVAPLQQKHDLIKSMASPVDDTSSNLDPGEQDDAELDILRRNAGVQSAPEEPAADTASEPPAEEVKPQETNHNKIGCLWR
jgi:hypothetical protein